MHASTDNHGLLCRGGVQQRLGLGFGLSCRGAALWSRHNLSHFWCAAHYLTLACGPPTTHRHAVCLTDGVCLPLEGSLGGTDITLTGTGFGSTAADNSVTMGGAACEIKSVSSTQIVCRAPEVSSETSTAVALYIGSVLSPNLCECANGIQVKPSCAAIDPCLGAVLAGARAAALLRRRAARRRFTALHSTPLHCTFPRLPLC